MSSRRQTLSQLGSSAAWLAAASWGLSGCGGDEGKIRIRTLQQSLPGSLARQFQAQIGLPTQIRLSTNRAELFEQLQRSQSDDRGWFFDRPDPPVTLTLLGSDWLIRAKGLNLIEPFPTSLAGEHWSSLDPRWQQAVGHSETKIWGVPWRWGLTAIGYNRQRMDPIVEWSDLWRPELKGRLTLPDHPREVIGLTLKSLGRSYNESISATDPTLRSRLQQLDQQVLAYTSSNYLQMFRIRDSWVTVGWTEDLYDAQLADPDLEVVIPHSGAAVWWDLWVLPKGAQTEQAAALTQWFNLMLNPATTSRLVDYSRIATVQPVQRQLLSKPLQTRADLDPQVWQQAEIWQPLGSEQVKNYLALWQQLRQNQLEQIG